MVSGAVAGDDVDSVAAAASEALGLPVAIVPIQVGPDVVGAVTAVGASRLTPEQHAWLEAASAAATVALLMRDSRDEEPPGGLTGDQVVEMLGRRTSPAADEELAPALAQARRLGYELGGGATALCALLPQEGIDALPAGALVGHAGEGRVIGLVPLNADAGPDAVSVAEALSAQGCEVALAAPRREPATLHEAVREAAVLLELILGGEALFSEQEDTYRLLIGVLLRDRDELEQLRERTVAPIGEYDAEHETELLTTLQAFLAHHGSTTETAEALQLHRHTVGYRLSRVQEVSGLSPYETDGRERLGLGLKANQILAADNRRVWRE
jgi:PucR family transcriptional regulator, purine catabolism regulatory protein